MSEQKFNCSTCDYFRVNAAIKSMPGVIQAANDNGDRPGEGVGHCYLKPPGFQMLVVPNKLDPRVGNTQQLTVFPIVMEGGTCEHHPARVEMLIKGAVMFAIRTWREYLDYRPGKNPDEIAAGFSRMPTYAEAKQHSVGGNEKPQVQGDGVAKA